MRLVSAVSNANWDASSARRRHAIATGAVTPLTVDASQLVEWLGRPKVIDDVPARTQLPGVATGLAVTGHGGDVLFIETTAFPTADGAEPGLTLTGQLGDVMKESAQIALNYVRSHAAELGIDPECLQRRFHVHVPAGAVPKDGPSARHHDGDYAREPAHVRARSRTRSG